MSKDQILLIGAGPMAIEYAKVLLEMGKNIVVVGRSKKSAKVFKEQIDVTPILGGIDKYLSSKITLPKTAIVAVSEDQLGIITLKLIKAGVKSILVEKPGGLTFKEIEQVKKESLKKNIKVFVGYNRRFYQSVQKVREIIKNDGGVLSFNFEFTELSDRIAPLKKAPGVKEEWFLQNSTHVIDLAFFLGGKPAKLSTFTAGKLPWHKKAVIFSGSGISQNGALFSYNANWKAPGRWSLELLTTKHRIILKPLEKLQIQNQGSFDASFLEIDDKLDNQFKAGLYKQVRSFLGDKKDLCTIDEQVKNLTHYKKILGG